MSAEKQKPAPKARKDKKVIVDEVWTRERVRGFLDFEPPPGWDADFNVLLRAYRSMRIEDFTVFIEMFIDAGREINARDPQGRTVLEIVSEHSNSGAYAEALRRAGAEK